MDITTVHKMKFIYNAIQDGWIVKKIDENNIEFLKKNNDISSRYVLDDYLKEFINNNLNNIEETDSDSNK